MPVRSKEEAAQNLRTLIDTIPEGYTEGGYRAVTKTGDLVVVTPSRRVSRNEDDCRLVEDLRVALIQTSPDIMGVTKTVFYGMTVIIDCDGFGVVDMSGIEDSL